MFSDFKTRGVNLEDSQITRTDRLDRLVLVLSLALYWAVSTGMWDAVANRTPAEKRLRGRNAGTLPAASSPFSRASCGARASACSASSPRQHSGLHGNLMGDKVGARLAVPRSHR